MTTQPHAYTGPHAEPPGQSRHAAMAGQAGSAAGRVRDANLRASGASLERLPDGAMLVRPDEPLRAYPKTLTDRVFHWAATVPDRICIAKREPHGIRAGRAGRAGGSGDWRRLTYAQVRDAILALGQALLDRHLSTDRPVAILSENDLEQFLLTLAGQHVGIPVAPISPAYSLVSKDFNRLRQAMRLITPGLIFAADGQRFARAIEAIEGTDAVAPGVEIVVTSSPLATRACTDFAQLASTAPTPRVAEAHAQIALDSIAKFLFTSGSTSMPKAVINTHRMLCSNQQMIAQIFGFLHAVPADPPVILDWLPWNHTFGGNHNIGIVLYNGGTYYIDEGKPAPGLIEETVRNLREISPTVHFNVPKGYEGLLPFLRAEPALRHNFFHRAKFLFYAAAGLSQPVWDAYRQLALDTCGERIIMATGLGSTETSPMAIQCTWETDRAGLIGIPVPGVELKLVPRGKKLEARVRGPNITPGYWRQPDLTAKVFDQDGFYTFGDAVQFVDPADVNKGFVFDGRFAEDFKLATGTWVSVGPLRTKILAHFAPYVRDVVITGHDRDDLGMLVFPDFDACCALCPSLAPSGGTAPRASDAQILSHAAVREKFAALLESFAASATGSSNRVVRAILVEEPPSLDAGEITDKGSLNQRAVIERRCETVDELYAAAPSAKIICLQTKET